MSRPDYSLDQKALTADLATALRAIADAIDGKQLEDWMKESNAIRNVGIDYQWSGAASVRITIHSTELAAWRDAALTVSLYPGRREP